MFVRKLHYASLIVTLLSFLATAAAPFAVFAISAFPGAEGYGAVATGGRGGGVYIVDSLADPNESGKTTLRDCIEDKNNYGARTCVFAVGGIIELGTELAITKPNITIAGQTAPGGGVTLKSKGAQDLISVDTSHVIIRYLRMRNGKDLKDHRALRIKESTDTKYVIVDHNSFSWSADELIIIWDAATHTTLQWNTLADSFKHGEAGDRQGKGPNLGGYKGRDGNNVGGGYHSFINNLVANMFQRNPRLRNTGGVIDVVNNLIYNPGDDGSVVSDGAIVNYIGNYIKSGQDTTEPAYIDVSGTGENINGSDFVYQESTKVEQYNGGGMKDISKGGTLLSQRNPSDGLASVTITSPDQAYQEILAQAGASAYVNCSGQFVTRRDPIDTKLFQEVANNTGRIKNTIADTLGFVALDQGTPCLDTDKDGMPDDYETAKGLNKTDAADGKALAASGYSNLEVYINGSDTVIPTSSPTASPKTTKVSDIAPLNAPDGKVDIFDYNLLLSQFGVTGAIGFHPADIIKNGHVDIFDYNKLLEDFAH